MLCCFFADDTIVYDPGSTAIHALICLHSAFKVFSSSYLYHSCLTLQTNGNSRLLNKTFQLQQFELVDICHIYSLFSIKFPHCVSSDSVSLMSFGTRKYFLVCSLVFKYLLWFNSSEYTFKYIFWTERGLWILAPITCKGIMKGSSNVQYEQEEWLDLFQ